MKEETENHIQQWLKNLERESWQLELLVSAFTIFLLVAASDSFSRVIDAFEYKYSDPHGTLLGFLNLSLLSLHILTSFLIIHLLIRGFWIGAIGLRSVNPSIDINALKYSDFFRKKFEKRLIGLDRLIIRLDEISSVIFSVSFLIIFTLISFGLYLLFTEGINAIFNIVLTSADESLSDLINWIRFFMIMILLLTGIMYMIDFFTLGFFKKFKILSRLYYPIYRFYGVITLSFISRSIYYNLISKYSKKRIRIFLALFLCTLLYMSFFRFDQYQFFPVGEDKLLLENNYYDDNRPEEDYIEKVSVDSRFSKEPYISLFIRYDPDDNFKINSNCPEITPLKNEGINPRNKFRIDDGLRIRQENFEEEDKKLLLQCLSDLYEVYVNDSAYYELDYYFTLHSAKDQKGILTTFSTSDFKEGENIIEIKKKYRNSSGSLIKENYARVPIWFSRD